MKKFLLFLSLIIIQPAWANLITNSVTNGCVSETLGITDTVSVQAVFMPKNVTCSTGQYLPVNHLSCEQCPSEATCTPGTHSFSETKSRGIVYNDVILYDKPYGCAQNLLGFDSNAAFEAIFTPMNIICKPGYYLSANNVECTQCPENNYCVGDTYTFNETMTQGITACPDGMFAPVGSWECYERVLHVGESVVYLKSHKVTEPSLHVKYDDSVYYANMTTVPTVMNRDSTHFLKIKYNSTEYYVCDDTTYKSDSGNN
jgi:hypothetical protein